MRIGNWDDPIMMKNPPILALAFSLSSAAHIGLFIWVNKETGLPALIYELFRNEVD